MSGGPLPDREALLNAYLDGLSSIDERAAFERQLSEDADLRAELGRHRELEASLKRVYGRGSDPAAADRVIQAAVGKAGERGPAGGIRRPGWQQGLAAAAAIALVAVAGWQIWGSLKPPPPAAPIYDVGPQRSVYEAYAEVASGELVADWLCRTEEEFRETFRKRFGQALALAEAPAGITTSGLAYANTLSTKTILLLAEVEGTPVVVFADSGGRFERPNDPPSESGLSVFRRQIGRIELFEVSPLAEPAILPLLSDPAANQG